MSDTTVQDCNCCEIESDCINGLCHSCSAYNYELRKDLAHETDMAAQAHVGCLQLQKQLSEIREAATKWPRCCDLWQDGFGGMHCRECSQKTFTMLRNVQRILKVNKNGKPIE